MVWELFFPKLLEIIIFSPTYHGVRFFPVLYAMRNIFFSADIFSSGISEITHTPLPLLKVKWVAP